MTDSRIYSLPDVALAGTRYLATDKSGDTSAGKTLVSDFLEPMASVKQYGALGDGATNDTAAIAAALTARHGKSLAFPAGTYLTDPHTLTATNVPCHISMFGAALKSRNTTNPTTPLVTLENVHASPYQPFLWTGGFIDGNGQRPCLKIHGGQGMHLSDMRLIKGLGDGLWISGETGYGVYYNRFTGVRVGDATWGCSGNGWTIKSIGAANFIAGNVYEGCVSQYNVGHGVDIDWASGDYIGFSAELNNGRGFNVDNTYHTAIFGGYSEFNHQNRAGGGSSDATADESMLFTANGYGILVLGGRHIGTISGMRADAGLVLLKDNVQYNHLINQPDTSRTIDIAINGSSKFIVANGYVSPVAPLFPSNNNQSITGSAAHPEGVQSASIASIHLSADGSVCKKYSGSGNTGWADIPGLISNTATVNPASVANAASTTTGTVTVTGAALGDQVIASFSLDLQGLFLAAWVSASNTVSYRFCNLTGGAIDLGSGTLKVSVRK